MLIVLAGTIGQSGLGGQVWTCLQYLAGLQALGHEVVYLEDCGDYCSVYDWEAGEQTEDLGYAAAYVRRSLAPFGFGDRWILRAGEACAGMPLGEFHEVCARADLLIMRAAPLSTWRPEYDLPRRRVFLDVDPGFTQMRIAGGDAEFEGWIRRCERHFTFGTHIGRADCPIPTAGFDWLPTHPPVALQHWPVVRGADEEFTTIMRWRGFRDVEFAGVSYGQKDREFPKFIDLPARTAQPFRLALLGDSGEALAARGWRITPSETVSRTPEQYEAFIRSSRAEFAVPKHAYVAARSGWVSDRSVCYLASGKPVLVEDTGFTDDLPTGEGLLAFRDLEEAAAGVEAINADYPGHCAAARRLAEEHFAAERVLPAFLDAALG